MIILAALLLIALVVYTCWHTPKFLSESADKWDGYYFGMIVLAWWNIIISVLRDMF